MGEKRASKPLHNISLHPAAIVLHYAQSIFEGMKAYRWADGKVALFRPAENARRFARSASVWRCRRWTQSSLWKP